jgi:hypothetical protein
MSWRAGVERIDWPWDRSTDHGPEYDERQQHSDALYGEESRWGYAIPMVLRALAAPDVPARMVRLTEASAYAYWSSLLHLLTYTFGWSRPAEGLSRWYFDERTLDDERFAFIDAVWVADRRLEEFVAQLWYSRHLYDHVLDRASDIAGGRGAGSRDASAGSRTDESRDRFVEEQRARLRGSDDHPSSPLSTGGDLDRLHLSLHLSGPVRSGTVTDRTRQRMVVDAASGRAVLHLDGMLGWYLALATLGSELPDRGERSWRVDVHVATVGHLGTFRRSRDTGLWFSGRHRYHLWGAG